MPLADSLTRPWVVALAGVAFLLAWSAGLAMGASDLVLQGISYNFPPLIALWLSVRAARRAERRLRAGWFAVVAASLAWGAAEWTYSVYTFIGREAPVPSVADVFYYEGYLALVIGVPLIARRDRNAWGMTRVIDCAAVLISAAALMWRLVISPVIEGGGTSSFGGWVTSGYPVLDLFLAMTLIISHYESRRQGLTQLTPLLAGGLVLVATDSVYAAGVVGGADTIGPSWLDLGWLAFYWLIAIASTLPASQSERRSISAVWSELIPPYVAAGALNALAVYDLSQGRSDVLVNFAAITAGFLLLMRQLITLRDNRFLIATQAELVRRLASSAVELEAARSDAQFLADHDPLTGLLNRRAWFAAADQEPLAAVALFDVDHFKHINDAYGHPVGDLVLEELGRELLDRLGSSGVVGRLGGEEFAVAFTGPVHTIREECQEFVSYLAGNPLLVADGPAISITVSVGVAIGLAVTEEPWDVHEAYAVADAALYEAKRRGRNQMRVTAGRSLLSA